METVTLALTIVFAVIAVWQAFRGYRRGPYRQILHIITSVASAAAAYFLTSSLADKLLDYISAETIGELFDKIGAAELASFAPYLTNIEWVLVLPVATLASPGIFVALYFVVHIALDIVALIIRGIFSIDRTPGEAGKNLIASVIGLAEGVLVAFIVCLPFVAGVNLVGGGVDAICASDEQGNFESVKDFDEQLGALENHFVVQTVNSLGGNLLLDNFATVKIDGEDVNLISETESIVKIIIEFSALGDPDYAAVDGKTQQAFRNAVNGIGDSAYLSTMISGVLSDMGHAAQDNIVPFEANPPYDELLYSLFSIFATSNKDNVEADLHTILDVYFLLSDGGSLKAYGTEDGEEDMKNAMISTDDDGVTLISKVVAILNENEHTKPLVTTLTKMTMTMLAEQLGGEYDVAEAYDKVKDGFESVAAINPDDYETAEEYEAARDAELSSTFADNGIELDDSTVNEIGDYIDENYGDKEELTDEEMNDILLYYYDVYASDADGVEQE